MVQVQASGFLRMKSISFLILGERGIINVLLVFSWSRRACSLSSNPQVILESCFLLPLNLWTGISLVLELDATLRNFCLPGRDKFQFSAKQIMDHTVVGGRPSLASCPAPQIPEVMLFSLTLKETKGWENEECVGSLFLPTYPRRPQTHLLGNLKFFSLRTERSLCRSSGEDDPFAQLGPPCSYIKGLLHCLTLRVFVLLRFF